MRFVEALPFLYQYRRSMVTTHGLNGAATIDIVRWSAG